MKGRWIKWLPEELAWIEAHKDWPRATLYAGFCSRFGRTDVTKEALKALCSRRGWLTGRTGQFEKGTPSQNKGKKLAPEVRAKCAPTMFKPGRGPSAARNYQPIGTERISHDGYVERKIHDGLPLQSRWRLVHLLNWEALYGPIPDGMCLKCRDGNRQNTDPTNWEVIERRLLPLLNGGKRGRLAYDEAAPEVKPVLMAMAKLRVARGDATRKAIRSTNREEEGFQSTTIEVSGEAGGRA
ncbi:HNH endonuclease [Rhodobacter maris]|uniref:HNH endonuclease n=1 Tax=Rhodobacter maris TaxID=446682 RepID=A0A285TGA0_9RHOB|nr:HNH endonuclease [Rhodobacter maris]SOC19583.1 HNH endonuclease [Rhodobacter maris]